MCELLCSCFSGLLSISPSALKGNKEIWTGKHSGSKGYTCEDNQSTVSPNVVSGHSVDKPSHSNRDPPAFWKYRQWQLLRKMAWTVFGIIVDIL